MVRSCNLIQTVREPTRNGNTLAIFLTNRPTLVNKCTTIPGLSDHDSVVTDTEAKRSKPPI